MPHQRGKKSKTTASVRHQVMVEKDGVQWPLGDWTQHPPMAGRGIWDRDHTQSDRALLMREKLRKKLEARQQQLEADAKQQLEAFLKRRFSRKNLELMARNPEVAAEALIRLVGATPLQAKKK